MNDRKIKLIDLLWAIPILSFIPGCNNPVDEKPLKWTNALQIPISNETFVIGDLFDNLFKLDSVDVLKSDSQYAQDDITKLVADTTTGDTLIFSILNSNTSKFETHQDNLEEKLYTVTLGAIAISGAPQFNQTIPLPAAAGAFNLSSSVPIEMVKSISFYDTAVNILKVSITNNSANTLTGVQFGIGGVDSKSAGDIPGGQTKIVELEIRNRILNSPASIIFSGTSAGGAGQSVSIVMDLNNLYASSLTADDHLFNYSQDFVNAYELTDTVDVNYIDIGDGFFHYAITNHTGVELRVNSVHEHLWKASFCERRGYSHKDSLTQASHTDSIENYMGWITRGAVVAPPQKEQVFSTENLSECRLYAEWDSTLQKSVSYVKYSISTGTPKGDTITIKSSDTLVFSIKTSSFKFKELLGKTVKPYVLSGDTQKVPINFPWNPTVFDSLRNRMILKNVLGDIRIKVNMPQRAFIDSIWINYTMFVPESSDTKASSFTEFYNVKADTAWRRSVDITDVTNAFPDTVAVTAEVTIPKGTLMRAVNDLGVADVDFDRFMGRMNIGVVTDYRLNPAMDWEIKQKVNMDLGSGRFATMNAFRFISKLEDKTAVFDMDVTNQTNLNIVLYALIAPKSLASELDSLPINDFYSLIKNPGLAEARGFVNFLSPLGVRIPPRNTLSKDTVSWNDQQLTTVVNSDTCGWRWMMQFNENERDALRDTDFIKINSSLLLKGTNNTDSLFIW